jgi:hypothetical protein
MCQENYFLYKIHVQFNVQVQESFTRMSTQDEVCTIYMCIYSVYNMFVYHTSTMSTSMWEVVGEWRTERTLEIHESN